MSKSVCDGCKFANWKRTTNGRLHPDGSGKCEWVATVALPPSCYTGGFGRDFNNMDSTLTLRGRHIWRTASDRYSVCPVRESTP